MIETAEMPAEVEKSQKVHMIRICDWVISAIFFLVFFTIPVFFTGLTFQGIVFDKFYLFTFLILVGMVAWVTKGVLLGNMRIRKTPIDTPLLALWVWYAIASIFSVDRWHSFMGAFGDPSRGFVALTFFILSFYFIISHATTSRVRTALKGSILAGFLVIVWTAYVLVGAPLLPNSLRAVAPISLLGSLGALTLYFGALLPIFITGLFLNAEEEKTTKYKILHWGMIATLLVMLICLFALYAFAPWMVILATVTFFVIYIIAQLVRPASKVSWLPMAVFVIILGFLMVGQVNIARINLPVEVSPSTKLSWEITQSAFGEQFLTGVGPANYGAVFSTHKPASFNENELYTMRFGQSNNLFLEMFATTGVIGILLFALTWMLFLGTGFYLLTYNSKETNKVISLGLWSVVMLFFLSSIFVTLSGALLLIFIPFAALAYIVLQKETFAKDTFLDFSLEATPKYALALAFTFMVVSAGVIYVLIFFGKVYVADIIVLRGNKALSAGNSEQAVKHYGKALSLYGQESNYYLRYAEGLMILVAQEDKKGEQRDEAKMSQVLQQAIAAGEVAARLSGNDVLTVEALAILYENIVRYAPDAANRTSELYSRASSLDPLSPLYYMKLGEVKRFTGDTTEDPKLKDAAYKEALAFFEQATEKKQNLSAGYYQKAITYSRMNQLDAAINEARKSTQYEPSNASYLFTVGALYELRNKEKDRDTAVEIYKNILEAYPNILDVRLSLALLYEKRSERDNAIKEYQTALDVVKKSDGDTKELQDQISGFLTTVRNGGTNIPSAEPVNPELPAAENPQPEAPAVSENPTVNQPVEPEPVVE